jgi:hypothetical protein
MLFALFTSFAVSTDFTADRVFVGGLQALSLELRQNFLFYRL